MTLVAAIHEAGHVWAYSQPRALPIRYVTIRPRTGGAGAGSVQVHPRRIDPWRKAWIASAGPVAEAIWSQMSGDPDDGTEWGDHLCGAVLSGGQDDLRNATFGGYSMLDDTQATQAIRDGLRRAWAGIMRLAEQLAEHGTVLGPAAFELLAAT
jgi:hypothetical protein